MNDMSGVIVPKSDQWNAEDFLAGPRTFQIADVQIQGGPEQPVSMTLEGSERVFRPCKSMCRVFVAAWGPDASKYIGRSVTLYRDPKVKWGGLEVGGIRISHMTDIQHDLTLALTTTRGSRKPYVVKPLVAAKDQPPQSFAEATRAKMAGVASDPAKWMRTLVDALASCPTSADLADIERLQSVVAALAKAPPAAKQEIEAAIKAAAERLSPQTEDAAVGTTDATSVPVAMTEAAPEASDKTGVDLMDDPNFGFAGLSEDSAAFLKEILALDSIHDVEAQERNPAVKAQARKLPEEDQPRIVAAIEAHKAALRNKVPAA